MICPKHGNPDEVRAILDAWTLADAEGRILSHDEIWPHGIYPDCFPANVKEVLPCTCEEQK